MSNFKVEEPVGSNGLKRNMWTFFFDDRKATLRATHRVPEARPTKRHKFRPVAGADWSWCSFRTSVKQKPEIPASVAFAALEYFKGLLKIEVGF